MANFAKILAINLKALMSEVGLNQTEFAEKTGVKQPVISRILNEKMDNPEIKSLEPLVTPFKKSVAWLLTDRAANDTNEMTTLKRLERIEADIQALKQITIGKSPDHALVKNKSVIANRDRDRLIELLDGASAEDLKFLVRTVEARLGVESTGNQSKHRSSS